MDVCGGLISCTETLIPVDHWATGDLYVDVRLFLLAPTFDTFVNYMVYICAQVLDILAPCHHKFGRLGDPRNNTLTDRAFTENWSKPWFYIQDWYSNALKRRNQSWNTLLLAAHFPKYYSLTLLRYLVISYTTPLYCSCYRLGRRDYAWSQIQGLHCGMYAGAWTNAMQSLWIAGQWMSHPSEHQEILELLERIEKESGWTTQWRADDLTEF